VQNPKIPHKSYKNLIYLVKNVQKYTKKRIIYTYFSIKTYKNLQKYVKNVEKSIKKRTSIITSP
jgi:ribosomal protein S30